MAPRFLTGTTAVDELTVYSAATAHPMLVLRTDRALVLAVGPRVT